VAAGAKIEAAATGAIIVDWKRFVLISLFQISA
jgi:hypothetical protein